MSISVSLCPKRVFEFFEEISAVPRGSGNMKQIADYCLKFAQKHSLKAVTDDANNVVIFKNAAAGYENAEPIILQGHLDIVCQKTEESTVDFQKDGLELYVDGDYLKAKGTTLGADNGIAVAMILAILEDDNIPHPAIEAVFTADEEIGMIGASKLDVKILNGKRMINLDSEDVDSATVSCAGGSDFKATVPFERTISNGTEVLVTLKGLKGGHSGICINEGRINANILAGRFLDYINKNDDFDIISIAGGDKGNAIPLGCEIKLCVNNAESFKQKSEGYLGIIKEELAAREPNFEFNVAIGKEGGYKTVPHGLKDKLIFALLCAPCGVVEMSAEIEGLVETSLNLGILKTEEDNILFNFTLRSNKKSALCFLEQKLTTFFTCVSAKIETSGYYPPWEFNSDSEMQRIYEEMFREQFGKDPKIEAIHAGLECGVFSDKIKDFDGIAIGPQLYDVHTVNERLSISSTTEIYNLLLKILKSCH